MNRANQIILCFVIIGFSGFSNAYSKSPCKFKDRIKADYKNFYSPTNLWQLTLGIVYAGFYANTSFDQEIQDFYNDYIKSSTTDNISKVVKSFGDGRITIPIYLMAALVGELTKDTTIGATVGEWGQQCSRAILVGAPPVLVLQLVLGSSRPEERRGSHWHPFKDNNGVSGHSFLGAVPFLTVAKMTNNRFLKYSFYAGSTLTGLSRINDNKHYFSQSFLGWWFAYLAVNSIKTQQFVLVPSANGIGFMVYF